jgi:uncharacterized protein YggE
MTTIVTGATGSATGDPDRAEVAVTAEHAAADARTASEAVADRASAVRDALADLGVADDRVRTTRYDVRERHRGGEPSREPEYRARHTLAVTVDDVDAAGNVVDATVEAGATRVDSVEFTFSDDRRRELRSRALADAMTKAREQAAAIADSEGFEVRTVEHVETQGDQGPRPQREALAADAAGGDGTAFESGPVEVTARVEVTYEAG